MAYKVDMEKAFDKKEGDLVLYALSNFGLPPVFKLDLLLSFYPLLLYSFKWEPFVIPRIKAT